MSKFINPYAFIRLPEMKVIAKHAPQAKWQPEEQAQEQVGSQVGENAHAKADAQAYEYAKEQAGEHALKQTHGQQHEQMPGKTQKHGRENALEQEPSFTGKIECRLLPRTPMFIPNTTNDNFFGYKKTGDSSKSFHKSYDFYSYKNLAGQSDTDIKHTPVIPGSSIRGEVRSLFEALTGSCFSTAVSERGNQLRLYKRMPDPGEMGLLKITKGKDGKPDKFELLKSRKYMACYRPCDKDNGKKVYNNEKVDEFDKGEFTEGEFVFFKSSGEKYDGIIHLPETVAAIYKKGYADRIREKGTAEEKSSFNKDLLEGYVLKGEEFMLFNNDRDRKRWEYKKHHFTIAQIDDLGSRVISARAVEALGTVLELYLDNTLNKDLMKKLKERDKKLKEHDKTPLHSGYAVYKRRFDDAVRLGGIIPVFYKPRNYFELTKQGGGNTSLYLSPSCITKEVFQNTITRLLSDNGNFGPCSNNQELCPACYLFGMVAIGDSSAQASRVRFSDASVVLGSSTLEDIYEEEKTLKELASPKVSATEFYVLHPNAKSAQELAEEVETLEMRVLSPAEAPEPIPEEAMPPEPEINIDVHIGQGKGKGMSLEEMKGFFETKGLKAEEKEPESEPEPERVSEQVQSYIDSMPDYEGEVAMYNYDIAFNWKEEGDGQIKRDNPIEGYKPRIYGRKRYWQHREFDWENAKAQDKKVKGENVLAQNKINNTVRPIKPCFAVAGGENPDYRFGFSVYFERLSKEELDKLIATLRLGDEGYHSFGHGKPFGMGSAKVEVDSVKVRKLSRIDGGIGRELEDYVNFDNVKTKSLTDVFGNKYYVRQTAAMCKVHDFRDDFGAIPIEYPSSLDSNVSYNWWAYNRGYNFTPQIIKVLPELPANADVLSGEELAAKMYLRKNSKP